MKKIILVSLLMAQFAFADDSHHQAPAQQEDNAKKITTKDAKKTCKEEGKTGPELIKCMKEKKEEK